ncbi:MAG: glycogen debranching enzyme, partial [Synechococcaceae cyanobacterium]
LMANAYWEPLRFALPPAEGADSHWLRWIDTAAPSPHDIHTWEDAPLVEEQTITVESRSTVVLVSQIARTGP